MRLKAVALNARDNVATAVANLEKGASVEVTTDNKTFTVELKAAIPLGHKFSLSHLDSGSAIIKYGEVLDFSRDREDCQ